MKMIWLFLLCLLATACKKPLDTKQDLTTCCVRPPEHKISVRGLNPSLQYLLVVDDRFNFDECRRSFDQTYSVAYSGFSEEPKSVLDIYGRWESMNNETVNVKIYGQAANCDQGALILEEDLLTQNYGIEISLD